MIIKSHTKDYNVLLHNDFGFIEKLKSISNSFWVIDRKVYDLYKDSLFNDMLEDLLLVEATEEKKTIETALDICEAMTNIPAKRNATLISIGGGIVQDITGFAANVLYRGINWEFVPTTLLAACDSCIGGKTSLNYKKYKNLLGTFYPPNNIHICSRFFDTLSLTDFESGLGEVIKFNILSGHEDMNEIESDFDELLSRRQEIVEKYLLKSLSFKKKFIEEDEFDKGIRVHLNFAHTFGHAFETVSDYAIPHGTAVAMGTIAANKVSLLRGWLDERTIAQAERLLLPIINIDVNAITPDMNKIVGAVRKDKKQIGNSITLVLIKGSDMETKVTNDGTIDEIEIAIRYLFDLLRNRK